MQQQKAEDLCEVICQGGIVGPGACGHGGKEHCTCGGRPNGAVKGGYGRVDQFTGNGAKTPDESSR
jgi:hypothetical protein